MKKLDVLKATKFGNIAAEHEAEELSSYFVDTHQWGQILSGEVDVIYGAKGSGKSAIYVRLLNESDLLSKRGITAISAANLKGSPIFQNLNLDLEPSQEQFRQLWKHYFLLLVANEFRIRGEAGEGARSVLSELAAAGLMPPDTSIGSLLGTAWTYVCKVFAKIGSVEVGVNGVKIELNAPSPEQESKLRVSAESLLRTCDETLAASGRTVWLLLDRLDVSFEGSPFEGDALRGLFKAYLDLNELKRISVKIFLRSDIWRDISERGIREASHIVGRATKLSWTEQTLLDLMVRRILNNESLRTFYGVSGAAERRGFEAQQLFFSRVFPGKMRTTTGAVPTIEWILKQTEDGTMQTAPREVIHLLNVARDKQIRQLERGEDEPPGDALFNEASLKEAMPIVSEDRLYQTLYQEYASLKLKDWIDNLAGGASQYTSISLAQLWHIEERDALTRAKRLVQVGFFRILGPTAHATFQIPPLYRYALNVTTP